MLPIEYLHKVSGKGWGNPLTSVCLYYPGANLDTGPLDLILRSRSPDGRQSFNAFATAIYIDININAEGVENLISRIERLYSTRVGFVVDVAPSDFGSFGHEDFFPNTNDHFYDPEPGYASQYILEDRDFFGVRIFFPEIQLNLVYLRAEAVQAYRILQKTKIYPNIVVLQDHGIWGFQHATFYGESLIYKAARVLPHYLYLANEGDPWPGFERVSDVYCDEGQEHHFERYLAANKSLLAKSKRKAR